MKLGELEGIIRTYVDIYIDCEPINDYIKEIHGSSEKILFIQVDLQDSKVQKYYDNEVWAIDCNNSEVYIRDSQKKYRKK